jgi:hypothetical protein
LIVPGEHHAIGQAFDDPLRIGSIIITKEPVNMEVLAEACRMYPNRMMPCGCEGDHWQYHDSGRRFVDVMGEFEQRIVQRTGKIGWIYSAFVEYSSSIQLGVSSRLQSGCRFADIPAAHPLHGIVKDLVQNKGMSERNATRSVFDLPRVIRLTLRSVLDGYRGLVAVDLDIVSSAVQSVMHRRKFDSAHDPCFSIMQQLVTDKKPLLQLLPSGEKYAEGKDLVNRMIFLGKSWVWQKDHGYKEKLPVQFAQLETFLKKSAVLDVASSPELYAKIPGQCLGDFFNSFLGFVQNLETCKKSDHV